MGVFEFGTVGVQGEIDLILEIQRDLQKKRSRGRLAKKVAVFSKIVEETRQF
jgi:hypothetical protein